MRNMVDTNTNIKSEEVSIVKPYGLEKMVNNISFSLTFTEIIIISQLMQSKYMQILRNNMEMRLNQSFWKRCRINLLGASMKQLNFPMKSKTNSIMVSCKWVQESIKSGKDMLNIFVWALWDSRKMLSNVKYSRMIIRF